MRIALLTDGIYPTVIGGMQKHSWFLAKYLSRAGVIIDLYCPEFIDRRNDFSGFTDEEKKNITFIPVKYTTLGGLPGHYIREQYDYSRNVYSAYSKRAEPDFIIAKGFSAWELLNQKAKGKELPPIGVNFHGYEMFQRQPGFIARIKSKLLLKAPVKFSVQHADYLFSYGGKITDIIRSLGVTPDRIIEIPTGISEEWVATSPEQHEAPVRFVYVGRYERRKGIEELNLALRRLIAEKSSFVFHFVGDIPADKKIASDKIVYHGKVTNEPDLRNILRSSDVLVCPSHSEGMPNVILEGMSSGLAVIASDTGATALMVSEKNGWLIEPGSTEAVYTAMKAALGLAPGDWSWLKTNSIRAVADQFTWTKIAALTIEKIERSVNHG